MNGEDRIDDLTAWLSRDKIAGDPAAARVGQVTSLSTLPVTPGSWYAMNDVAVSGTEAEGASATFTATGGSFRAFNIGSDRPTLGDVFLCTPVGGRYVFKCGG